MILNNDIFNLAIYLTFDHIFFLTFGKTLACTFDYTFDYIFDHIFDDQIDLPFE